MYNDDSNTLTEGIAGGAEEKEFIPAYGSEWKDKRFNLQNGYSFWLSAVPIKMFSGCGLPSSLGFSDCGKLYRCAMLMQQHTNMLFYHSHGVDKPLTVEKLADRLGVNIKYCYSLFRRDIAVRTLITHRRHIVDYRLRSGRWRSGRRCGAYATSCASCSRCRRWPRSRRRRPRR